jgi:hypothetical protein
MTVSNLVDIEDVGDSHIRTAISGDRANKFRRWRIGHHGYVSGERLVESKVARSTWWLQRVLGTRTYLLFQQKQKNFNATVFVPRCRTSAARGRHAMITVELHLRLFP